MAYCNVSLGILFKKNLRMEIVAINFLLLGIFYRNVPNPRFTFRKDLLQNFVKLSCYRELNIYFAIIRQNYRENRAICEKAWSLISIALCIWNDMQSDPLLEIPKINPNFFKSDS